MKRKGTPLRLTIHGKAFLLEYDSKDLVQFTGSKKALQFPLFPPDEPVLYYTTQQNFPLFESVMSMKKQEVALMLNLKKKFEFVNDTAEKAKRKARFEQYSAQTKKQLGTNEFFNNNSLF